MGALEKIRLFAADAHGGQKRKYSGEPYIRHPERVAAICVEYNQGLPAIAAALLHDVLEDTETTPEELEQFLYTTLPSDDAKKTLGLVIDLTDIFLKEDFPHFNRRTRKIKEAERLRKAGPEVQTIKYADIMDNAVDITRGDPDFSRIYLKENLLFIDRMERGNPALRRRAEETVKACLNSGLSRQ